MASSERTPGQEKKNPGASRRMRIQLVTEVVKFLTASVKLVAAFFTQGLAPARSKM